MVLRLSLIEISNVALKADIYQCLLAEKAYIYFSTVVLKADIYCCDFVQNSFIYCSTIGLKADIFHFTFYTMGVLLQCCWAENRYFPVLFTSYIYCVFTEIYKYILTNTAYYGCHWMAAWNDDLCWGPEAFSHKRIFNTMNVFKNENTVMIIKILL